MAFRDVSGLEKLPVDVSRGWGGHRWGHHTVLPVLTAPDTRPRIPGQPVLTHKWELAGCERCVSSVTKGRFTSISLPGVSA